MDDPRYRLNVDFDNTITPFQYNGTGSYTFTVPATPNHLGTRYVVFLPAVLYLKEADKLPAISGYTRIENAVPSANEFRTIVSAQYDTLLLKDAIEFPASAAGATLTMTNFWTIGSTVTPDYASDVNLMIAEIEKRRRIETIPPNLFFQAAGTLPAAWDSDPVSGIAENSATGVVIATNGRSSAASGKAVRSTDRGQTWTQFTILSDSCFWGNVVFANGVWLAIAYGGHPSGQAIARSTDDGVSWAWVNTPTPGGGSPTIQNWLECVWATDRFVCTSYSGYTNGAGVMWSFDGLSWTLGSTTALPLPVSGARSGRLYYNKETDILTIAFSSCGTALCKRFAYSADRGQTWTHCVPVTESTAQNAVAMVYSKATERWTAVLASSTGTFFTGDVQSDSPWGKYLPSDSPISGSGYYGGILEIGVWRLFVMYGSGAASRVLSLSKDMRIYHAVNACDTMRTGGLDDENLNLMSAWRSQDRVWVTRAASVATSGKKIFYATIPEDYR